TASIARPRSRLAFRLRHTFTAALFGARVLLRLLHLAFLTQRLLSRTLEHRLRAAPAHQRRPLERARRAAMRGTTVTLIARASSSAGDRSKVTRVPRHRSPRTCPASNPVSSTRRRSPSSVRMNPWCFAGLNQIIVPSIVLLSEETAPPDASPPSLVAAGS